MDMQVHDIQTGEADDLGRFSLGPKYANKRVTVAVMNVEGDNPGKEELAAAYRNAAENAERLADEWDETSTEAWNGREG